MAVFKTLVLLSMVLLSMVLYGTLAVPQCDHHYGVHGCRHSFVPAPPGKRPPCAAPGATFCEKLDSYPDHLIQYLIERWGYDYKSLLADESRTEYKTPRPPPAYHPYHYSPGYTKVPLYYPPHPSQQVLPHANGSMPFAGYPDRRYKLDPQFVSPLVYTAVLPPQSYMPSEDWWTRFSRSVDAESKESQKQKTREKRQSNQGNTIKLCPTNFQYIRPKAAVNNRGNWMFVVNEVNDYSQLVRSETCATSSCNGLCSLPNGYSSSCQQQYVQKRLVALEGSGDRLYTDLFWFPHCCICQITQNNNSG